MCPCYPREFSNNRVSSIKVRTAVNVRKCPKSPRASRIGLSCLKGFNGRWPFEWHHSVMGIVLYNSLVCSGDSGACAESRFEPRRLGYPKASQETMSVLECPLVSHGSRRCPMSLDVRRCIHRVHGCLWGCRRQMEASIALRYVHSIHSTEIKQGVVSRVDP